MKLGWCDVCLNVEDLEASKNFYETFGFEVVEGDVKRKYYVMKNGTARIGLYKEAFEGFMLNFRGGDVLANSAELKEKGVDFHSGPEEGKDGGASAMILDPDGNMIFLDTHPDELEPEYQKKVGVLPHLIDE